MSTSSPALTALALRVNELLSRASCMTTARRLAESCLADPLQPHGRQPELSGAGYSRT
jgi:hypothetical protein